MIFDGKKGRSFRGKTPLSAAKKAYKKLSAELGKSSVKFELQETTKDFKNNLYGPYKGCVNNEKINVKLVSVNSSHKVYKPHKYILKGGLCTPPQPAANYVISCHASSYGIDPHNPVNWTDQMQNRTLVSYVNYGERLSDDCAWIIWAALLGDSTYLNHPNCMNNISCSNQMLNLFIWVDKGKKSDLWGIYDCTNPSNHHVVQKWTSVNLSANKDYRLQHVLNDIHNDWWKKYGINKQYSIYNVHILACG